MKFDVLMRDGICLSVCVKPHPWSDNELISPFSTGEIELETMPYDYLVELPGGVEKLASEIDPRLVEVR